MKVTMFAKTLVFGITLAAAASGCHKSPTPLTKIPEPGRTGNPKDSEFADAIKPDQSPSSDSGTPISDPKMYDSYDRNAEIFKADIVHFDFDSSVVKTEEKPYVAAVADYLKANSENAVEIQGHCDERGTEEYNRSLGERRALALREEMIHLGIDPVKVVTISYGFNRPADPGHDESAWKKNRRGEFILLTPPTKLAQLTK